MVWFLIGFVVTLIYIIKDHEYFDILDYPIAFLIGMFLTTITWVLASLIVTCAVADYDLGWEIESNGIAWKTIGQCELEMINDTEYVNTVILDEEMCHQVSIKRNGLAVTEFCEVENTIIQEGEEAIIEEQTPKFQSNILNAFFTPMLDIRYVITIPSE